MQSQSFLRFTLALASAVLATGCGSNLQNCYRIRSFQSAQSFPSNVAMNIQVSDTCNNNRPVPELESGNSRVFDGHYESQWNTQSAEFAALMKKLKDDPESDNNALQLPQDFQISTILLLDLSGSVTGLNGAESTELKRLKESAIQFAKSALKTIPNRKSVISLAVYTFDGNAEIQPLVPFTQELAQVEASITSLQCPHPVYCSDTSTNLNGAVIKGLEALENRKRQVPSAIHAQSFVIFTDGTDRASRETEAAAILKINQMMSRYEASVYTIGVGTQINDESLKKMGPSGSVKAANWDEAAIQFNTIASMISDYSRSFYSIRYCSPKRRGMNEATAVFFKEGATPNDPIKYGVSYVGYNANGFRGGCNQHDDTQWLSMSTIK